MASERERAFAKAAAAELKRLPALQRKHVLLVVAELEAAQQRIVGLIASSPTSASRQHWERVSREIDRQLGLWRQAVAAQAAGAIDAAFAAGIDAIGRPLTAAGVQLAPGFFRIDPRTTAALRAYATDRLADVAAQARASIRSAISQHALGALRRDEAVDLVNRALGGQARRRAMTIVNTETGRGYSFAQYESTLRAAEAGVPLMRRWVKSGKREPRGSHVEAHDQVVGPDQPFEIFDVRSGGIERLRFPRDPRASAANTVNCGCRVLPVVDGSTFDQVDPLTGELLKVAARLPADPRDALTFEPLATRDARGKELLADVDARLRAVLRRGPSPG